MALIPSAILGGLLWRSERGFERERVRWEAERSKLLTRVQAPKAAAVMDIPDPEGIPLYVPFDDDGAMKQYERDREAGLVE